jgi:hypothetical protein
MCECLSYIVDRSTGSAFLLGYNFGVLTRMEAYLVSYIPCYKTADLPLSGQLLAPFRRSLLCQYPFNKPNHLVPILHTLGIGRKSLILQPLRSIKDSFTAECTELRIVACREHDEGVLGGEDLVWDDGRM